MCNNFRVIDVGFRARCEPSLGKATEECNGTVLLAIVKRDGHARGALASWTCAPSADCLTFWGPFCTLFDGLGCTSVVFDNCDVGLVPCHAKDIVYAMLAMVFNEAFVYVAMKAGMPWDSVTLTNIRYGIVRTPKGRSV